MFRRREGAALSNFSTIKPRHNGIIVLECVQKKDFEKTPRQDLESNEGLRSSTYRYPNSAARRAPKHVRSVKLGLGVESRIQRIKNWIPCTTWQDLESNEVLRVEISTHTLQMFTVGVMPVESHHKVRLLPWPEVDLHKWAEEEHKRWLLEMTWTYYSHSFQGSKDGMVGAMLVIHQVRLLSSPEVESHMRAKQNTSWHYGVELKFVPTCLYLEQTYDGPEEYLDLESNKDLRGSNHELTHTDARCAVGKTSSSL
ncbi:hypothetical protein DFH07DRAFT_767693 [Mycena maculata]|uniref:Uncharacterized protein n=1 Tax=Mycena maculata TaxID=230809 RepID=A0AAD7JXU0_9AGAR|nr:hypothetical protein DFH07DRAFT_767693 [Mycena maculata]